MPYPDYKKNTSTNDGSVKCSNKTTRRLKVYYGTYQSNSYSRYPVIHIVGKYLKAFGFKTGDAVELTLSEGQIVIKKVRPE